MTIADRYMAYYAEGREAGKREAIYELIVNSEIPPEQGARLLNIDLSTLDRRLRRVFRTSVAELSEKRTAKLDLLLRLERLQSSKNFE